MPNREGTVSQGQPNPMAKPAPAIRNQGPAATPTAGQLDTGMGAVSNQAIRGQGPAATPTNAKMDN